MLKNLSNHHLALVCINLVVNVVIWEGETKIKSCVFNELSSFCQNLLKTLKKHLEIMIINNGMFECDQLLIVHFKSEYQRINEIYTNLFDIQIGDCYPYTLNGILTDF